MLRLAYSLRTIVEEAQMPWHFPGLCGPSGDRGDWKKMEEDEEDKEGVNGAGEGREGQGSSQEDEARLTPAPPMTMIKWYRMGFCSIQKTKLRAQRRWARERGAGDGMSAVGSPRDSKHGEERDDDDEEEEEEEDVGGCLSTTLSLRHPRSALPITMCNSSTLGVRAGLCACVFNCQVPVSYRHLWMVGALLFSASAVPPMATSRSNVHEHARTHTYSYTHAGHQVTNSAQFRNAQTCEFTRPS